MAKELVINPRPDVSFWIGRRLSLVFYSTGQIALAFKLPLSENNPKQTLNQPDTDPKPTPNRFVASAAAFGFDLPARGARVQEDGTS